MSDYGNPYGGYGNQTMTANAQFGAAPAGATPTGQTPGPTPTGPTPTGPASAV